MKAIFAGVMVAALAASVTSVRADDTEAAIPLQHGYYFAIGGGLNMVTGGDAVDVARTPPNLKFKFNDGPAVYASAGYKWDIGVRAEMEFTYRSDGVKDFISSAFPLTGHQTDYTYMANVFYDIDTKTRFMPYIGAGIGASTVGWRNFASAGSPLIIDNGSNSTKLAFQGIVGTAFALAPQWDTTLDFRYKGSTGHSFAGIQAADTISGYKLREMSFMVGLRYAFDSQARSTGK